jgi:hypothetical protein
MKSTNYEIFIGVLALLSIFNLFVSYFFLKDAALQMVMQVMNALLSAIFLADFTYRLFTAESKSTYFFRQFGWADLLSSLPFEQLKILRLFRLWRVYQMLRQIGPRNVVRSFIRDRAQSALLTLLLAGIFVLEFGSIWMLRIEEYAQGANITTASDAIWYTIVTISTVGYGDQYPVTNAGRLLGSIIIIVGVGIFGTFTGYLANLFLAPRKKEQAELDETPGAARLERIRSLLAQQQAEVDELERLLNKPEG